MDTILQEKRPSGIKEDRKASTIPKRTKRDFQIKLRHPIKRVKKSGLPRIDHLERKRGSALVLHKEQIFKTLTQLDKFLKLAPNYVDSDNFSKETTFTEITDYIKVKLQDYFNLDMEDHDYSDVRLLESSENLETLTIIEEYYPNQFCHVNVFIGHLPVLRKKNKRLFELTRQTINIVHRNLGLYLPDENWVPEEIEYAEQSIADENWEDNNEKDALQRCIHHYKQFVIPYCKEIADMELKFKDYKKFVSDFKPRGKQQIQMKLFIVNLLIPILESKVYVNQTYYEGMDHSIYESTIPMHWHSSFDWNDDDALFNHHATSMDGMYESGAVPIYPLIMTDYVLNKKRVEKCVSEEQIIGTRRILNSLRHIMSNQEKQYGRN